MIFSFRQSSKRTLREHGMGPKMWDGWHHLAQVTAIGTSRTVGHELFNILKEVMGDL
jgi:hypothetical protein